MERWLTDIRYLYSQKREYDPHVVWRLPLPPPFAATYERELFLNLKTPIEDRSPPSIDFKELGYDDRGVYVDFLAFLPAFSIRQTILLQAPKHQGQLISPPALSTP
jgi:hypothetical protein